MQHYWRFTLAPFFTLLLMFACAVTAKQTHFKHQLKAANHQFSYSWQKDDAQYALQFTLPTVLFENMPSTQAAFSNVIMQREIEVALLKHAQSVDPRTGRVSVKRQGSVLEYSVNSRSQADAQSIMQALETISITARADYLSQRFYTDYKTILGVEAIKHDHAKYAQLSADGLIPVVDAIKAMQQNVNDPREFIGIALSWMQSIPYSTLEDRVSSNGSGYVSPKDLLMQNQGDCDSKATFLAALMRAYSQSVQQKLVLLPKHALLAVAIPANPDEKTISSNGTVYVLLEAAGPGYFDIGQVADSTLLDIRNRQYSLEAM